MAKNMRKINIFLIAGARPNYVKVAALWKAYLQFRKKRPKSRVTCRLINTGQHYDYMMSKAFFKDLDLPAPYVDLGVGSDSHASQTAKIMSRFEKLLVKKRPDLVIVVGDVNSTMACTLVASKMEIPVAHVEAGLRSFDRTMPEEINRLVTDALADYLFTTSKDADLNLLREGVSKNKIHFVGNVMVDTLLTHLPKSKKSGIKKELGLNGSYAVLTLHRPSNVDRDSDFRRIADALERIQKHIPIVFPVHPRTAARLRSGSLNGHLGSLKNLKMVPPVGYLDFIHLLKDAKLVLTDSGGIQEETTVLGVPCLTLRANTERPVTMAQGTNILAGMGPRVADYALRILEGKIKRKKKVPPRWDGKTAPRNFQVLSKKLGF